MDHAKRLDIAHGMVTEILSPLTAVARRIQLQNDLFGLVGISNWDETAKRYTQSLPVEIRRRLDAGR